MLEKSIVDTLECYLMTEVGTVFREVPFLQRYIDIIGYDKDAKKVVAVEAKIKNWPIALRQARACLLCSDEVFIALPYKFVHRVDHEALNKFGIGLLSVGQDVRILLKPQKSRFKHKYHYDWLTDLLDRINATTVDGG